MFRKILWGLGFVVLAGGIYWSVAHATVHPESPVGRCLNWLGMAASSSEKEGPLALVSNPEREHLCCYTSEPATPVYPARLTEGVIHVQPTRTPMSDADGNPPALTGQTTAAATDREVVTVNTEVRLMPEILAEEPVLCPVEKKTEVEVAVQVCPVDVTCSVTFDSCCKMLTLAGLYEYVSKKIGGKGATTVGGNGAVGQAEKAPTVCPAASKEVGGVCPAASKVTCPACPARGQERKPEPISEPPAEVEQSEAPITPRRMSALPGFRGFAKPCVDTMDMRPGDIGQELLGDRPF